MMRNPESLVSLAAWHHHPAVHAVPCMTLHASLCSARAWNADFVLGMDMRVQQVGSALEHLVPELHRGVHVKEALQVRASSDGGQLLM